MIFEIMEMGMTGGGFNPKIGQSTLFNNSYSSIVGSVLAFYIGMGRITNVFGTETKIVVDPESMTGFDFMKLSMPMKAFIGGGDSGFVLGATNKLLYAGCDFEVKRARTGIDWIKSGKENIPRPIKLLITLGVLGILGAALLLRFKYGVTSSSDPSPALELASTIIPLTEGAWMSCLMLLEYLYSRAETSTNTVKDLISKKKSNLKEYVNISEQKSTLEAIGSCESDYNKWLILEDVGEALLDANRDLEDKIRFNERNVSYQLSCWLIGAPKK